MADHIKRMEAEAKAAQVSRAVGFVSTDVLFLALNFAFCLNICTHNNIIRLFVLRPQVIENGLDPNQALILVNQNQSKAIKPYDLSRALAPLIDIEASKLMSVHQKIDENRQNDGWRYLYGLICRVLCMDFNFKSIQKY